MFRIALIALLTIIFMLASLQGVPAVQAQKERSGAADHASNVVTGVIEEIDAGKMKLKIKTDLGKNVFFETTNPDLLKELGVGDRITAELGENGKAIKVTKVAVPEMKAPTGVQP